MSEARSAEYEMRCHYEVFELPRECSEEDIKKQYKKLALRYHPDKNIGNEEEATQRFKEISTAYSVLSDPKERRWYDEHREQILRGCAPGSGNSAKDTGEAVDLWRYFSSSCYSGQEDSKTGFYSVYSAVFKDIYEAEMEAGASMELLPFGNSTAPHDEVAAFYAYWSSFNSKLSFAWEDRYNPNEAPNRDVRRAIDKENKKFRDAARKSYVDTVRALCDYVKKRDKRMIAWAALAQAERKRKDDEQERKKTENAARKREERRARQEEIENDEEERLRRDSERQRAFLLADESSDESSTGDETNDEIESYAGQGVGRVYSNEELVDTEMSSGGEVEVRAEDLQMFLCEVCRKSFKSQPQLNAHLASKNHRKAEQEAKKAAMKGNSKKAGQSVSVVVDKIATDLSRVEVGDKGGGVKKDKQGKQEKSKDRSSKSGLGDVSIDEDDNLPAVAHTVFTLRGRHSKSVPAESVEDELLCCRGCGESFDSRNSLFTHLSESGHAIATAVENTPENTPGGQHKVDDIRKKKKSKSKVSF